MSAPDRPPLAPGDGRGRVLYLDTPSGVAGDMTIAALLDLGVPESVLDDALAALPLGGYRVEHRTVTRAGIVARRFDVPVDAPQPERHYVEIRDMVADAALPPGARDRALEILRRLGEAEARVHRTPLERVHFHEVGAVDSIVDVVGVAALLDWLSPARIVVSSLPMSRGHLDVAHGRLPMPAPATVELLAGVPTHDSGIEAELVTPTGAAIVATQADAFGGWPSMRPRRTGWGGGKRDLADRPNLLRAVLGDPVAGPSEAPSGSTHAIVEANIDDATGECIGHALEALLDAGAVDAWTTPIGMKKSRPGVRLAGLASWERVDAISRALLAETSTLGVRVLPCRRVERPRRIEEVDTPWGRVPVKVADGDGIAPHAAPEYEACRALAARAGVPLRRVMAAALAAWSRREG